MCANGEEWVECTDEGLWSKQSPYSRQARLCAWLCGGDTTASVARLFEIAQTCSRTLYVVCSPTNVRAMIKDVAKVDVLVRALSVSILRVSFDRAGTQSGAQFECAGSMEFVMKGRNRMFQATRAPSPAPLAQSSSAAAAPTSGSFAEQAAPRHPHAS